MGKIHGNAKPKKKKKDSYKKWLDDLKKPSEEKLKSGVSKDEHFRRVQEERKQREAELKHRQSSGE